jgi:Cft2 family RNA processing exonuclease
MKYEILGTGSSGNCVILDNIMLDCGLPYKQVKQYLKDIKLIFISHKHSDHLNKSTIKKIAYNHPTIKFLVAFYLVDLLLELGVEKKNILTIDLEKWYNIGIANVKFEPLFHDVPNVALKIQKGDEKVIYIVDTNSVEHIEAKDYNLYMIEANYIDEEELENRIKKDYEDGLTYSHYERVQKTHLSQQKAYNWLQKNMNKESKFVFLHAHKDKEEQNENTK